MSINKFRKVFDYFGAGDTSTLFEQELRSRFEGMKTYNRLRQANEPMCAALFVCLRLNEPQVGNTGYYFRSLALPGHIDDGFKKAEEEGLNPVIILDLMDNVPFNVQWPYDPATIIHPFELLNEPVFFARPAQNSGAVSMFTRKPL
jgi:hypothetical protein